MIESSRRKARGLFRNLKRQMIKMAGYNGYSKSNNAVAAESAGYVVRTNITKTWLQEGGINESPAFIKWLASKDLIAADEWHHTSMYYNETNYYSTEGIAEELNRLSAYGNLDQLRRIYAVKEARKLDKLYIADLAMYMASPRVIMSEIYTSKIEGFAKDFNLI